MSAKEQKTNRNHKILAAASAASVGFSAIAGVSADSNTPNLNAEDITAGQSHIFTLNSIQKAHDWDSQFLNEEQRAKIAADNEMATSVAAQMDRLVGTVDSVVIPDGSSVSAEQAKKYNITDIDELAKFVDVTGQTGNDLVHPGDVVSYSLSEEAAKIIVENQAHFDSNDESGDKQNGQADRGKGHDPVTICHATGSENNPFVQITVDDDAVDGNGNGSADHNQDGHQNGRDIIPPGFWDTDGRNWDSDGQTIYNNDCEVEQETPTPVPTKSPEATQTVEKTASPRATRTVEVSKTPAVTRTVVRTTTPAVTKTVERTKTVVITKTATQEVPTETSTNTPTATATATETNTATATATVTATETRTVTPPDTKTPKPTRTATPTSTATATNTATVTASSTPTETPTIIPGLPNTGDGSGLPSDKNFGVLAMSALMLGGLLVAGRNLRNRFAFRGVEETNVRQMMIERLSRLSKENLEGQK